MTSMDQLSGRFMIFVGVAVSGNDTSDSSCLCFTYPIRRIPLRVFKRNRDRSNLEIVCKKIRDSFIRDSLPNSAFSEVSRALESLRQNYMVTSFAREAAKYLGEQNFPAIDKLSEEYEIKMAKRLENTKISSTVAPMLGSWGL